ncbi:MAG TPA: FAD-dependent oxidoreductase [Phycisphaerae bacterium]|nr:FAD-dependent oxidoreductase [Phycisphaerae bacterium]
MADKVLIVGGGITGMQAATTLGQMGIPSILLEKADRLGGRVRRLSRTFPFFDKAGFTDGADFVAEIEEDLRACRLADVRLETTVTSVKGNFPNFTIGFSNGRQEQASAIVLTTGFEPFDPTSLEEYGYGRYPNVVTAPELEWMLNPRGPTGGQLLRPSDRKLVDRLALVFCVGSRNRRIGAPFCSRICCSFSTKQAITVRERNPNSLVVCFYIDVRTYDRGFEEMYSLAQDRGVKYVRGRVSTCKELPDGSIGVKAENTLIQRPFWGEFDMVSLSTGMRPCADAEQLSQILGVGRGPDGFFVCQDWFRYPHDTTRPGIFVAGCAMGMKPIRNCLIDAGAVAARVAVVLGKGRGVQGCDTASSSTSASASAATPAP